MTGSTRAIGRLLWTGVVQHREVNVLLGAQPSWARQLHLADGLHVVLVVGDHLLLQPGRQLLERRRGALVHVGAAIEQHVGGAGAPQVVQRVRFGRGDHVVVVRVPLVVLLGQGVVVARVEGGALVDDRRVQAVRRVVGLRANGGQGHRVVMEHGEHQFGLHLDLGFESVGRVGIYTETYKPF